MSRSPEQAVSYEATRDYLEAFERTFRMHQRGKSFSGNERNCVFLNTGQPRFANISAVSGLDFPDDGRGLAVVDWDHDGDLDLWFANRTAPQLRFLRNNSASGGDFLALRLEGRSSNRDAIGARAELQVRDLAGGQPYRLTRVLRAGDGFLSQSGKWLHFGLGTGAVIDHLEVWWPGGEPETFEALLPNRRYRVVQGSDTAEEIAQRRPVELPSSKLVGRPPLTPGRVVLSGRVPLPLLTYRDFNGAELSLEVGRGQPALINLWATWCAPCVVELKDLVARQGQIRAAGLEVVALSVDGLDQGQVTTPADAERFLADLTFPFGRGVAEPELLSKLQLLHDGLFSIHLELAVPTSFLIDGDGRLAAIYRGRMDLDRLLEDTRNLRAPRLQRRLMATPLPGRWLAAPQELRLTSFARRFMDEGLPEDAIHYLRLAVASEPDDGELQAMLGDLLGLQERSDEAVLHWARAVELGSDSAGLRYKLAAGLQHQGRIEEAMAQLREVLRLDPDNAAAHNDLGALLLEAGQTDSAIEHLRGALAAAPGLADAHNNLGIAFLRSDQLDAAERHFRSAIEMRADFAAAYNNLGVALLRRGKTESAIAHFRRALAIQPTFTDARDNLDKARRAAADR